MFEYIAVKHLIPKDLFCQLLICLDEFTHVIVTFPISTSQPLICLYLCMCFKQSPFENPEWFYRHVEMHSLCVDIPAGECDFPIRCGWKGSFVF